MFIAHFTERPYQDPASGYFGATGKSIKDLTLSNEIYDPELGANLYNRYLDERLYAERDGLRRADAQRASQHALLHGRRDEHRGGYSRADDQARQDCPAGQHHPHLGRPTLACGAARHHRHDFARQAGLRLGARHRTRERGAQRAAAVQLGTLPGGARLHREGVDDLPVHSAGKASTTTTAM